MIDPYQAMLLTIVALSGIGGVVFGVLAILDDVELRRQGQMQEEKRRQAARGLASKRPEFLRGRNSR